MRVHLPLQQGLRLLNQVCVIGVTGIGASASSITTRIKTRQIRLINNFVFIVRVHLPLQQGLRLSLSSIVNTFGKVRVHLPLQQGLRLFQALQV